MNLLEVKDPKSLCLLGHLIVANQQIHAFEVHEAKRFLECCTHVDEQAALTAILDGREDATTFEDALIVFSQEDVKVQTEIYACLNTLAWADGTMDTLEQELLQLVKKKINCSEEELFSIAEIAKNESNHRRQEKNMRYSRPMFPPPPPNTLWKKIKAVFVALWVSIWAFFQQFFGEKKAERAEEDVYTSTIQRCAEIAQEDFAYIKPIYHSLLSKCNAVEASLVQAKGSLRGKDEVALEAQKAINDFAQDVQNLISEQEQQANGAILQKEHTLMDFTMALIGRTKAGKTTLHSILTREGQEHIGGGGQRTTRFNRVYQWNLLRLIDTPGIGAADEKGREDEAIALQVLGEADIVCFVVSDDTIQNDVLETIREIVGHNKPVIVVLNHKAALRSTARLDDFLENPNAWLTDTGENRLQGHIDRLKRDAEKYHYEKLLTVCPVYLLAAALAQNPPEQSDEDSDADREYKKTIFNHRKTLWDFSNIDAFIDRVEQTVAETGVLKRSQTILDDSVYLFEKWKERIADNWTSLTTASENLQRKSQTVSKVLTDTRAKFLKDSHNALERHFDKLAHDHASAFAERNYKRRKEEIPALWEKYLDEEQVSEKIQDEITVLASNFTKQVQHTLEDTADDLHFSFAVSDLANGATPKMEFDFRLATKIASVLLGACCFIPGIGQVAAIACTVAGIAINLIAGLFKSKAERRQEAIDRLYLQLKQNIEEQAPKQIESIVLELEKQSDAALQQVWDLFNGLLIGLISITKQTKELVDFYCAQIAATNKVYAWRILEYLNNRSRPLDQALISDDVCSVERTYREQIHITTPCVIPQKNMREIEGLCEKIIISSPKQG